MIKSVRIKKVEGMILDNWMDENKHKLIEPITQSELIHILISCGITRLKISEKGELIYR